MLEFFAVLEKVITFRSAKFGAIIVNVSFYDSEKSIGITQVFLAEASLYVTWILTFFTLQTSHVFETWLLFSKSDL